MSRDYVYVRLCEDLMFVIPHSLAMFLSDCVSRDPENLSFSEQINQVCSYVSAPVFWLVTIFGRYHTVLVLFITEFYI